MAITYDSVKPWGRLFSEYVGMFALTPADLQGRHILGCGDGPASFNAEATAMGHQVISIDPIYSMSAAQIEQRVNETWQDIVEQMRGHMQDFVWTKFSSLEEVRDARLKAMRMFLTDFERGKREGRYLEASLPDLPFADKQFDLALCSNFLFLYSDHLSTEFHIAAIEEMCRVAREVRVFPLQGLNNQESVHLAPVIEAMQAAGWRAERVRVDYEFHRGSDHMLRVHKS
jgi:ubiquinone/menaquinone biosynthesis C-methylase UbiE